MLAALFLGGSAEKRLTTGKSSGTMRTLAMMALSAGNEPSHAAEDSEHGGNHGIHRGHATFGTLRIEHSVHPPGVANTIWPGSPLQAFLVPELDPDKAYSARLTMVRELVLLPFEVKPNYLTWRRQGEDGTPSRWRVGIR